MDSQRPVYRTDEQSSTAAVTPVMDMQGGLDAQHAAQAVSCHDSIYTLAVYCIYKHSRWYLEP